MCAQPNHGVFQGQPRRFAELEDMQKQLRVLADDETTLQSDLSTLRKQHGEMSTLTEELQSLVDSIRVLEQQSSEYEQESAKLSRAIEDVQTEVAAAAACSSCDQESISSGLTVEEIQSLISQKVSRLTLLCPQSLIDV